VLLACWNIVLAGGLREAVRAELRAMGSPRAEEVTDDPDGGIVVGHLVGLARHARPDTPASVGTTYFQEDLPAALTTEITGGRFDVIVLDEAQDLSDLWMFALDDLLAPDGRWYAFADRHQDIFASQASLKDFLELEHELRENFRNTRHITEFAAQFGPTELDCINADGPPVRFVATASDDVIVRTMVEAGRLQRNERIPDSDLAVLWLFNNPMRGRNDELAEEAAAGQLVHTNSATFKGIERPVVVLGLDLDPAKADRGEEVARTIYVAATRARSHLTVVGDPDVAQAYGFAHLADQLRASTRRRRRV
jgi:superfamily I DNA/RNA helicase